MKLLNSKGLAILTMVILTHFATISVSQQPNFTNVNKSTGWDDLEGFVYDSTGQQYVWEKMGKIWVVDTNGVRGLTPLINITQEVGNWRDHGLNGVVLDPNFRSNGFIYLLYAVDRHHLLNFGTGNYSQNQDEYFDATIVRLTRYKCDINTNFSTIVQGSRHILIGEDKKSGIPILFESHSGGCLVFGTDGSLMVSTGDGGSYGFADGGSGSTYWSQAIDDSIIRPKENVGAFRAQMIDCLNGKILRIDPATGDGLSSNPYFDASDPRAPKSRVWALGLRNPFRMTLKPGTGEEDISAGNPGTLYIGDVGWDMWEDLNINTEAAQNFGWPLYEGLTPQTSYQNLEVQNPDEPNPLFGIDSCALPFYRFKDLLKQATLDPDPFFYNPCDSTQEIAASAHTFIHQRPVIDWAHGLETRVGIYNGLNAAEVDITDPASPVEGTMFGGYSSIAGFWYNDTRFPPIWQNTYFHTDFAGQWIKNFVMDSLDRPQEIRSFWDTCGTIVCMAVNPRNGCITYASFPYNIREICYTGIVNNPPTAVPGSDVSYGPGPLTVHFTGNQSTDPENQPLLYKWKFGDGDSSSLANPTHIYATGSGQPLTYYAKLKVTDNVGQTNTDSILISVNNTPPVVTITSFDDGDLYSMNGNSTLPLQATVTDAQHGPGQLFYQWTTFLHHNFHTHIEEVDTNKITTTVISPIGCDTANDYHFSVRLKVTDAAGLSTTVESSIYPSCTPPVSAFRANDSTICKGSTVQFTDLSTNFANQWKWTFTGGTPSTSTLKNPSVVYSVPGNYAVQLIATSSRGSDTLVKSAFIHVKQFPTVSLTSSNGTNEFCPENSYSLTANSNTTIASYAWIRYNVPFGTNAATQPLTKGGNYKVTVTDIYGCTRQSLKYVVTKLPFATISVTASGPLSFCAGDSVVLTAVTNYPQNTFSWKKYSNIIPGATASTYTAYSTGIYKAIATTVDGCVRASSPFAVDVSCDPQDESSRMISSVEHFRVFPNPVTENATLEFTLKQEGYFNLRIIDITGRQIVLADNIRFTSGLHQFSFDTFDLSPGLYQVIMSGDDQIRSAMFMR